MSTDFTNFKTSLRVTPVATVEEKRNLLEKIIDFSRTSGTPIWKAQEAMCAWTIVLPTEWSLLELDPPIPEDFADLWAAKQGEWFHQSKRGPHEVLGMSFAWWATKYGRFDDFDLYDAPDIRGRWQGKICAGDIGKCSLSAFRDGFRCLEFHSYWISVLNSRTFALIKFLYCPREFFAHKLMLGLSGYLSVPRDEAIRRSFWCPECQEWTITESLRNELWANATTADKLPTTQPSTHVAAPSPTQPRKRRMRRIRGFKSIG